MMVFSTMLRIELMEKFTPIPMYHTGSTTMVLLALRTTQATIAMMYCLTGNHRSAWSSTLWMIGFGMDNFHLVRA